jgi:hypothetical protein
MLSFMIFLLIESMGIMAGLDYLLTSRLERFSRL